MRGAQNGSYDVSRYSGLDSCGMGRTSEGARRMEHLANAFYFGLMVAGFAVLDWLASIIAVF